MRYVAASVVTDTRTQTHTTTTVTLVHVSRVNDSCILYQSMHACMYLLSLKLISSIYNIIYMETIFVGPDITSDTSLLQKYFPAIIAAAVIIGSLILLSFIGLMCLCCYRSYYRKM